MVRRRHDAHVDLDAARPAEPLEPPLLQHAQQLDLRRRRDVTDLVEEQRAAVGHLEATGLRRHRAGERALLVAEELALEQRLGQRARADTETNGLVARSERLWIARAMSSLPVPDSP